MILPFFSVLIVGLASATPAAPSVATATTCPADDVVLRSTVAALVAEPSARSSLGMMSVDPSHLRALAEPSDLAACQQLQSIASGVPDGATSVVRSYYTADGFYFAAVRPTRLGGYGGIYVFDSAWHRKELVLI